MAPVLTPESCEEEAGVGAASAVGPAEIAAVTGSVFAVVGSVSEVVDEVGVAVGLLFCVVPSRTKTPRPSLQQEEPNPPSPQQ